MRKTVSPFYLPIALLTLLWIAIPSCSIYDYFPEEEPGIIVVSLDGVTMRAAGEPINTGDEEIKKVRIFVFVGEVLEKNEIFTEGNENFNNPFVLNVVTGNKDVYVIANEDDGLTSKLEIITTKAGLMAVMASDIGSPLTPPLLMTGKATNVSVTTVTESYRNTITVPLTRVAAKINLQFKKDTSASVKITNVKLLNNTVKTSLWNGVTITGQSYWPHEMNLPSSPLELSTTLVNVGSIYVYENLTEGGKTNATQLEVEALYNNMPTTYRVYINENVSSSSGNAGDPISSEVTYLSETTEHHYYSIKRNHEYRLIGTIRAIDETINGTITYGGRNMSEPAGTDVPSGAIITASTGTIEITDDGQFRYTQPASYDNNTPVTFTYLKQVNDNYKEEYTSSTTIGTLLSSKTITLEPKNFIFEGSVQYWDSQWYPVDNYFTIDNGVAGTLTLTSSGNYRYTIGTTVSDSQPVRFRFKRNNANGNPHQFYKTKTIAELKNNSSLELRNDINN